MARRLTAFVCSRLPARLGVSRSMSLTPAVLAGIAGLVRSSRRWRPRDRFNAPRRRARPVAADDAAAPFVGAGLRRRAGETEVVGLGAGRPALVWIDSDNGGDDR